MVMRKVITEESHTIFSLECAYSKIPLSPPLKKGEALPPFVKGGSGGLMIGPFAGPFISNGLKWN